MVFVYPNSLSIDPVDPLSSDSIRVSAWIGSDNFDRYCFGGLTPLGFTPTYIHLMRRNLTTGQMRAQATPVDTYDCYTKCCLEDNTEVQVPGHPGKYGWQISFDIPRPFPAGKWELFAVDEGDYSKTVYPVDRVGALTFTVQQDPSQPITYVPNGSGGAGTAPAIPCDGMNRGGSFDPMCIMEPTNSMYLYGAIGLVILVVLLSGSTKK